MSSPEIFHEYQNLETLEVEGNQLSSDWFRSLSIGDVLCDEIEVV